MRTFERRQRELANEKAQVEDDRGALELQTDVTGDARAASSATARPGSPSCSNRLAAEDFAWVDANAAHRAAPTCDDRPQNDFAAFQAQFGS